MFKYLFDQTEYNYQESDAESKCNFGGDLIKIIVLLGYCLTSSHLFGQISITKDDLPGIGDTLLMATDEIPTNINLGSGGPDQMWIFSNLQAPYAQPYIVKSNTSNERSGSIFTDADYQVQFNDVLTGFYKYDGNVLRYLGSQGEDPIGFGVKVPARWENEGLIEYILPLNYGDRFSSQDFVTIPLASKDLSQEVLDQLPIQPDSFRINTTTTRASEVDGWGTLLTEAGKFQVLRLKRTEKMEARLEAKFSFLPWQDITDLLPNNPLLGKYTRLSFHFLSNQSKEPIAIAYTNENQSEIDRIEFKSGGLITKIKPKASNRPNILAYPNPAIIAVRFQFTNLPTGTYQLKIFSLLGKELWEKKYFISGDHTEKVSITHLNKGAYFYSLVDGSGKTLMTRRLVVLRP